MECPRNHVEQVSVILAGFTGFPPVGVRLVVQVEETQVRIKLSQETDVPDH